MSDLALFFLVGLALAALDGSVAFRLGWLAGRRAGRTAAFDLALSESLDGDAELRLATTAVRAAFAAEFPAEQALP
jgi:hypothetical protein